MQVTCLKVETKIWLSRDSNDTQVDVDSVYSNMLTPYVLPYSNMLTSYVLPYSNMLTPYVLPYSNVNYFA